MLISEYVKELQENCTLTDTIKTTLDDYHKHTDYIAVKVWDSVISGYFAKPRVYEEVGNIEGIKQNRYITHFFESHNIVPYQSKDTESHFIYYVSCPWKDNHTSEESETASFISIDKRSGIINYFCHHAHCDGKQWQDYKRFYAERDGTPESNKKTVQPKVFDIKLIQGRELQQKELPPIVYPVENMIPEGYTVFSAPFKYGKSWFALEMCLAISQGADFLGHKTTKGTTIYFALEDCDKFAQERLNIVLDGKEAPEGFYYIMEGVPSLDDGFIDYLNQLVGKMSDIKLIVIDILALIEHQPKRNETAYKCDYRTGTALKKWADEHSISVMAITHTTKLVHPNDIFMNTSGTSGVTGSADAIMTIAKNNRADEEGVLAITGRRVREKYLKVHLKDGFMWENLGEVNQQSMQTETAELEQAELMKEYYSSNIRKAILKIADSGNAEEMSSRQILDEARKHEVYLLCTVKDIGLFIHRFQNYFYTEDNIKVFVRKRGTASNLYTFKLWEDASSVFDEIIE